MEIKLYKKPKSPIIIEGFPGFGLVGTIASEFLIDHLKTEMIGKIIFNEMPAMVAIHDSKVVEPLGIFYNKEYNIVLLHAVTPSTGFEWNVADTISRLAKMLKASEIISMEGVGSGDGKEEVSERIFFYTNNPKSKERFSKIGIEPLSEGIIIGVTGAVMLRVENIPMSCVFAETHSKLPDSKAAAKVIEVLDKYLDLNVDYKPLLEQAKKFEEKLKTIIQKTQETQDLSEKKKLSYLG
ncbi:proteasome assembly chaperone family protein [Candidatus Woesearchaeota archaeon]|nr:proteasome assembly chaperone family protein [Candidatus Woesearchaeota archaeon]